PDLAVAFRSTTEPVMSSAFPRRLGEYENIGTTRRTFLLALSATVVTPRVMAQSIKPAIATRRLNNVMVSVSEMQRSVEFYQKLFGTPLQQGDVAVFRLGEG